MKRKLVYVAGPYTNPDPVENTHRACQIGKRLIESGVVWPVVPHQSLLFHVIAPFPYQTWLDLDIAIMERCDAVLRFSGESSGADAEVAEALRQGIPVFYDESEVVAWAGGD